MTKCPKYRMISLLWLDFYAKVVIISSVLASEALLDWTYQNWTLKCQRRPVPYESRHQIMSALPLNGSGSQNDQMWSLNMKKHILIVSLFSFYRLKLTKGNIRLKELNKLHPLMTKLAENINHVIDIFQRNNSFELPILETKHPAVLNVNWGS